MDKKQYTKPSAAVIAVKSQSILTVSDGQKMPGYSSPSGNINYNDDNTITTSSDIW